MNRLTGLVKVLSEKKYNKFVIIGFFVSVILVENSFFGKGYLATIVEDFKMADMNFFNSLTFLTRYLQDLGDLGRRGYLRLLSLDFVLIVTFFFLQATLIMKLLKSMKIVEKYQWLILIPLARSIFDCIETASLCGATLQFPEISSILLLISCVATPLKWISMYSGVAVILILIVLNILKRIENRKRVPHFPVVKYTGYQTGLYQNNTKIQRVKQSRL